MAVAGTMRDDYHYEDDYYYYDTYEECYNSWAHDAKNFTQMTPGEQQEFNDTGYIPPYHQFIVKSAADENLCVSGGEYDLWPEVRRLQDADAEDDSDGRSGTGGDSEDDDEYSGSEGRGGRGRRGRGGRGSDSDDDSDTGARRGKRFEAAGEEKATWISLQECDPEDYHQVFMMNDGLLRLAGEPSLCLDVYGYSMDT